MRNEAQNKIVGNWGERIMLAFGERLLGEPVRRVKDAGDVRGRDVIHGVDFASARYAIEVKCVLAGGEEKIRPTGDAFAHKRAYAVANKRLPVSVLIVLSPSTDRGWFARIYTKEGFGAYRSGGMVYRGTFDVAHITGRRPLRDS